ncbi:MAG: NADH-quinone oxidoreductase subunit A [Candidatus Aramenus sp.]|jgi:NADH-quinone oxidoreductase subunit A|nr:NADH-quinone oxidoreductase subunit A [Candidatus Aramenus sp.]
MSYTQAIVAFGLPAVLFLLAGYGGYKVISLIVPHEPSPLKVSRFEAGNIPTGEGRLWFPLQYYGYLLVYTSLEPIVVLLFLIASAPYYTSLTLFRNLMVVVSSSVVVLYPVLLYAVRQINMALNWELRR